jgi:integrase
MYQRCIRTEVAMAWKATGKPTVRQQRERWVVRVDGIDVETGRHRPRQLGTYPSRRAATRAAADFIEEGELGADRGTVGHLVDQWVASRTDVGPKTKSQYEWAAGHIRTGLGSLRLDRLDRADVARWLEALAADGVMGRRSIGIFRMVLRAALADAVEAGDIRRSPAARVPMPRTVAKPDRQKAVDAWDEVQLQRFLDVSDAHRWAGPLRLAVLYGLRHSELLGLRWSAVDLKKGTLKIEAAVVEVHGRPVWTDGKNACSRRAIPLDPTTLRALQAYRRFQAEERLAAGHDWVDNDLVVATRTGNTVSPGNLDQTLERIVRSAGVPPLTSHGLRHTAATHMVRHAADVGEVRAAADLLGHSPDMLMKVYAHVLPESLKIVTDKIGRRSGEA